MLTQGVFEVTGIHHNEIEDAKLIEYAALAESASSHPISKSLQKAYGREPDRTRVSDIQEVSGNGVIAKVDGVEVAAGNNRLIDAWVSPTWTAATPVRSSTWQSTENMRDIS